MKTFNLEFKKFTEEKPPQDVKIMAFFPNKNENGLYYDTTYYFGGDELTDFGTSLSYMFIASEWALLPEVDNTHKELPIPTMKPKEQIDIDGIIIQARNYISYLWAGDFGTAKEIEHYIFEGVITALYGEKVWELINKINE